ncbi:reverse transcriptase domain-containing protein [Tanacetum coccineum]
MEDEEDKEMEVEDNDAENDDAEVYNPYKEADPLNRPPPSHETSEREIMNAPVTRSTLQFIPPIQQFSGTIYVGEGSFATVFNPTLCKVYPPGPMEKMQEMKKLVAGLNEQFQQIQGRYLRAENEMLRIRDNAVRVNAAGDRGGESVDTTAIVKDAGKRNMIRMMMLLLPKTHNPQSPVDLHVTRSCLVSFVVLLTMALTRRSQTNPPPPLTQEAVDQLVRNGIKAAIRAERERVREEANRTGGPAGGPISECTERRKVKFATATLHGRALTWWNSQVATLGLEVENGKSWTKVKQTMIDEFCPTEEVQRLEDELRHLKLRDMDIAAYTERFNELALLCPDVFPNEKKKVELYIKGLLEIIKGETTSSSPTMLNDAVRMTHTLMEQKIQAKNERIAEGNKRRWENNNQGGNNNRNNHGGPAPKCNHCGLCHFGSCPAKCTKCNRMGHKTKDYRARGVATGVNA